MTPLVAAAFIVGTIFGAFCVSGEHSGFKLAMWKWSLLVAAAYVSGGFIAWVLA